MLRELYEQYRQAGRASMDGQLALRLYPPLLLRLDPNWRAADHRLVWVGQETFRDGWSAERVGEKMDDMLDFFDREDAVEAMMRGYCTVEGTLSEENLPRGPFWRFIKKAADVLEQKGSFSIVATNLIRCAVRGEKSSIKALSEDDQNGLLDWQNGLLTRELAAIKPTAILFTTGPCYDSYLAREFPNVRFEAVPPFAVTEISRLHHPNLSVPALRTYHPKYMNTQDHLGFAPIGAFLQAMAA